MGRNDLSFVRINQRRLTDIVYFCTVDVNWATRAFWSSTQLGRSPLSPAGIEEAKIEAFFGRDFAIFDDPLLPEILPGRRDPLTVRCHRGTQDGEVAR